MTAVLAVDMGGSKLLVALVDDGRVVTRFETPTDRSAGAGGWVTQVATMAAPLVGHFDRIGVAVTGRVDGGMWSALNTDTLDVPDRYPLAEQVAARLGATPVLANDGQAAAWGEYLHGAGAGLDMVFLTISTGIGGGIVANGKLLTGRSGLAGNFGQALPLTGEAVRLEDNASGRWIARAATLQGHDCDARSVFAAASGGADWADRLVRTAAERVARLCRNLQITLDPTVIVIGGGIGLAAGFLDRVRSCFDELPPHLHPSLARAALGSDAGVIGIAALAKEK